MLDLSQFQIEFDIRKPTPYFQSTPKRSIRFLMEDLNASQLKEILQTIFKKTDPSTFYSLLHTSIIICAT
ncbi:hypothetical protein [uncultured Exiguobacterium sp.]|uniref:hypothetical protein n=1 Tax=uncultured Exiguobacterium sp. TaxID=202669 RepID=UPI0037499CD1